MFKVGEKPVLQWMQDIFDVSAINNTNNIIVRAGRRVGKTSFLSAVAASHARSDNRITLILNNKHNVDTAIEYIKQYEKCFDQNIIESIIPLPECSQVIYCNDGARIELIGRSFDVADYSFRRSNMILIDDANVVSPLDIGYILGLKDSNNKMSVVMTYTPQCSKQTLMKNNNSYPVDKLLYRLELNHSPGWKYYHVPATMSAHWTSELETSLKQEFPPLYYAQEMMAEIVDEFAIRQETFKE